jgi:hypothetical protein
MCGDAGACHRPEQPAGQEGAHETAQEDDGAEHGEQDVPELRQLVPEPLLGEEVVELGLGARNAASDYEVPRPRYLHALVGEPSGADEPLQVGRKLRGPEREARGEAPAVRLAHDGEGAAALIGVEELGRLGGRRALVERFAREHEVEAALLERAVNRVGETRFPDEQVGADREDGGREPGDEHECERQAPAEPTGANGKPRCHCYPASKR